ncbi:flagellar biosynthesis protein FlhF, partial [Bordetella petrii]|uniref:flagellar biosynthesis protein FlhF n=1 Tax=Bordetella petrii TaxID=94624 RepID=UPI001E49D0C8
LPPVAADAGAGLEAAIGALRGALENRLDGLMWGGTDAPGREPLRASMFRMLLEAGFSARLARAMLERLPGTLDTQQARAWVRNELVTHLPVLGREDELWAQGGVFALVGPTGVGKTTTLAKLAARCVAREGRDQVAMLTTDNFRIGALEQLQIYGRLMGVPARSVRDVAELRAILSELGGRKIILIDTTGISQRDRNVAAQAALLCGAGRPVRRLLVLNAASQGDTLDEVAHAYRHGAAEDVAGCIITKLDEASRLGSALDTAIRHRLPVHYVCVGQKVPEDLALARSDTLVDRALAAQEQAPALYAPSEADMATRALDVLQKNPNGYFLMVEGGRIDHALHDTNAKRALQDTVAFDNAIKATIDKVRKTDPDLKNTLIVVTADHDHTLVLNGYAARTGKTEAGKPGVLGVLRSYQTGAVAKDADGAPYTIIG